MGETLLKEYIIKRVIDISNYIIETKHTVREAAKVFGISKSTVHKDCTERAFEIDRNLFNRVKKILQINLSERHLRGGEATKKKYLKKRQLYNKA
jgi:putative DeoR family transcriptional regulator (stage III sporulation protein D)